MFPVMVPVVVLVVLKFSHDGCSDGRLEVMASREPGYEI
jgi:hypothetical protein